MLCYAVGMKIWAIADLHLALSVPEKTMEFFGEPWRDYMPRIEKNWKELVNDDDLVLIAGDITWAMHLDDAKSDLEWIAALPGKKVISKGNHDYWWPGNKKMDEIIPENMRYIHNNVINEWGITIGGTRLWDTPEFGFDEWIDMVPNPHAKTVEMDAEKEEKIYVRELDRLERSLKAMDPKTKLRIAMVHYPPIGPEMKDSRASKILEKYKVDYCLFGHLHSMHVTGKLFGVKNGVDYRFTAADYLHFVPMEIATV